MVRIWTKRLSSLVIIYYVQRVLYLAFNLGALTSVLWPDKIWSFVVGLRFDLAAIMTLNVPLIAMHGARNLPIPPESRRLIDRAISVLFVLVNVPFIAAGVADAQLYTFTGRRMTLDYFAIVGDIKMQGVGLLMQYWPLTLTGCGLVAAMTWWSWQNDHTPDSLPRSYSGALAIKTLLGIVAIFLMIRGGWQHKPLAPAHAFMYQPAAHSNLVLNSAITLLRTPPSEAPQHFHDFASMDEIRKITTPGSNFNVTRLPLAPGRNVVIIIVESLASEYVGAFNGGKGYTPFIDSLVPHAVTFKDSFANGRRSIDAMPAIFAGIPAWRDQPFITSPYSGNDLAPLPKVLRRAGYRSLYFHGAANGSMHFDVFSEIAGFDRYIGRDQYPGPRSDDDGQWGIFDEPFLAFTADTLNATQQPFLAGVFTLTSHNPFRVPEQYAGKLPKGTLPIHESIAYADESLRKFFDKAKTMPWYPNTIFVITGDHTSLNDRPEYNNIFGQHRVPILFFDPQDGLPRTSQDKVAQQVDIAPTLLDILGLTPAKPGLFGWSLLDPDYHGRYIQSEYGQWYRFDGTSIIHLNDRNEPLFYAADDQEMKAPIVTSPTDSIARGLQELKAMRQYFSNGLVDNTWYK